MPSTNSPNRRVVVSPAEAREQAAEFFGFAASKEIKLADGTVFEIPNPGVMDDEQQQRFEELQVSLDAYDHEDVEVPIIEGEGEDRKLLGFRTVRELKSPHRLNGELVRPPYNVRLAKALFGDEGYEKYRAGGGIANQIALEWARMDREFKARMDADPK